MAFKLIRCTIPAQNASMQALGAQLGQHGFKVIDFCKQFNETTKHTAKDTPLTCIVKLKADRSFTFDVSPPKTAHLLKMAAASRGGTAVLDKDCYNIALLKNWNGPPSALKGLAKSVVGSANSMNLEVIRTVDDQ